MKAWWRRRIHDQPSAGSVVSAPGANIANIGDHAVQTNYFVAMQTRAARFWTEPLASPPPLPVGEVGVSALLGAQFQVVPYVGRVQEQHDLITWRDTPVVARAVRLIHGPGGMGKTRLVMQFAADSQAAGWAVAIAHHHSEPARASAADPVGAGGLLLLVDYAERWPREDLETLLRDFACGQPAQDCGEVMPVRVVLIARPAGLWWSSLANPLTKLGFSVDEQALRTPATADRRSLFDAARDRFAALLAVPDPSRLQPVGSLDDPVYELTLTVQMTALVAVDAAARRTSLPATIDGLSGYLLDREIDHWASMFDNHRIATDPRVMGRVVTVAALTGAVAYEQAAEILTRAGLSAGECGRMADDHRLCYPSLLSGTALQPVMPDRLAEDFLARIIPDPADAAAGDPWAAGLPERLLTTAEAPAPGAGYTRRAVIVLVEAAHRAAHLTTAVLTPLLRARPDLAVTAGSAALLRLATLPGLDTVLTAVDNALPVGPHTELDVAAASVSTRLLPNRLADSDDPAEHARIHRRHASRLASAGRHREAVAAMKEAISIQRRLAATDPAHELHFAQSLNNLGVELSAVGQRDEALTVAEEAVAIYRRLAAAAPAEHAPGLARVLDNLGNRLSDAGRRDEALTVAEKAVAIYRLLATADPATHEAGLALALNNFGIGLSEVGRREQAAAVAEEAVAVYRLLALANPAAHEPNLATLLSNLGNRLSEVGRWEEALAPTEEAVAIRRRLVTINPAAHEPDLADSLNNLGIRLSEVGRRTDALITTEEAVAIWRRLTTINPTAYEPVLAKSLNNLALWLSQVGRWKEAVTVTEEADPVYRLLALANPAAHEPNLATYLSNLGNRLSEVGRWEEALAVTEEAVAIQRRLATANPAAYGPGLAGSLDNLGTRLSQMGRHEQALTLTEEGVTVYRRLTASDRSASEPGLALLLSNLGIRLAHAGRYAEALTPTEEAVAIRRRLAATNPTAHERDLAKSLNYLGPVLLVAERHEEALTTLEEAVTIWRRLAKADPTVNQPHLAEALCTYAVVRSEIGEDLATARTAAEEAVETYHHLHAMYPSRFKDALAVASATLGDVLGALSRHDGAVEHRRQTDR
ncbi:tetratricopeptide repeat protein [Nocardia aurantia]|uniref:Tetratricopeptide repeat protein n=1 Tax=Nocardia aurantia TaxID=2585199 RepID=A0A7K0DYB5_9NOCA|nr:tetratricopeptide repeat protein [Nocardia aurantia]MQY30796.1 hypothetical protein [Nocardia aurantia]